MAKDKDKEGEKPRNKLTKVRPFVSLVEMGLFVVSEWVVIIGAAVEFWGWWWCA